jgi:hypothetical protein
MIDGIASAAQDPSLASHLSDKSAWRSHDGRGGWQDFVPDSDLDGKGGFPTCQTRNVERLFGPV